MSKPEGMIGRQWAAKWSSTNRLDGHREWLIRSPIGIVKLFHTRKECSEWINQEYGYIRGRKDLRAEPHCWRIPKPVRVTIQVQP